MTIKQRATLYHQLSRLLTAGMHMDRSLELLLDQSPARGVRAFLKGLQRGLNERLGVADSVAKHNASQVSGLEISLLAAGERGGRLEAACANLASYFEMREKSRSKAVGALIYPLLLMHLGLLFPDVQLIAQGGGLDNMVPQAITRLVFAWIAILVVGISVTSLLKMAIASASVDRLINLVPLVGACRRHWALARFSQVLHTCLLAALKISESVRLAGSATQSAVLDKASLRVAREVEQGNALSPALKKTGAFPRVFCNAMETAEHTGTLDLEAARWGAAEAELAAQAQDRAAEWLPRIFYVIVVLYIGYRIISMFSGYYGEMEKMMDAF